MKRSERADEGVIFVDHRDSPGMDAEFLAAQAKAFPGIDTLPPDAGKGVFEAPLLTCGHCQRMVIINPKRNRDREKCPNCRRYLCDLCGGVMKGGGVCRPIAKVIDEMLEEGYRKDRDKSETNRLITFTD